MMFTIPFIPWASYFEEGFVITSTCSMLAAGMVFKAVATSLPNMAEGLPSTKRVTFSFPRTDKLPSGSTFTEGTLRRTSAAVPPAEVMFLSTLNVFLSTLISIDAFSPLMVTSFKLRVVVFNWKVPPSLVPACMLTDLLVMDSNPIEEMVNS